MAVILIESSNVADLTPQKLETLRAELSGAEPNTIVEFAATSQHGYGVTWWEVVYIWLKEPLVIGTVGAVAGKVLEKVVEAAIDWVKESYASKGSKARPRLVSILDKDGKVLKSFEVKGGTEPHDCTNREREKPPRKLPSKDA